MFRLNISKLCFEIALSGNSYQHFVLFDSFIRFCLKKRNLEC